jgi:hypothetical protein
MANGNSSVGEDMLKVLRSIDAKLGQLVRQSGAASVDVADDADLDGTYGNPKVNFNPRDWRGDSMKGVRFSECPAEFLDLLAGAFDYFARKAEESGETTTAGKPVAPYKRKDAARARGWAKRIRAGYAVDRSTGELTEGSANAMPASTFDESEWPAEPVTELTDNDIPF